MTPELSWLLDWFRARGSLPDGIPEELTNTNYFEANLVDSFGVIELILDAESYFGIRFVETHFQERRFSTILGLSEVIAELKGEKDGTGNSI